MQILKTPEERWDPKVAALLVVDIQNDFCSHQRSGDRCCHERRRRYIFPPGPRNDVSPAITWTRLSLPAG
jgi:nicotinamidase-related amidase